MRGHESEYIISSPFHMSHCFTLYVSDRLMMNEENKEIEKNCILSSSKSGIRSFQCN